MDAPRPRFRSVLEWLAAALVTAMLVIAGSLLFREVRTIQATTTVEASTPALPSVPAGVPSRAVSIPLLLLPDGTAIRLGERASAIAARLGEAAQVTAEAVDRGAGPWERVTRLYSYSGMQFALVLEAPDGSAEPRITGIYLQ